MASVEGCDDGNQANGDGCDSLCAIESAHYCDNTVGSKSTCSQCISNCLNCSSGTDCTLCDNLYIYVSPSCTPNCSVIENCVTCRVVSTAV